MDSVYVALKALQDNSTQSTQVWSMMIALAAVIIGPFVSFQIAKRTIKTQLLIAEQNVRASVLSRNRQEWINLLRNTIAEYLAVVYMLGDPNLSNEKAQHLLERLYTAKFRVSLLINPNEPDHRKLDDLLFDFIEKIAAANKPDEEAVLEVRQTLVELSQKILKEEWKRVKSLQ